MPTDRLDRANNSQNSHANLSVQDTWLQQNAGQFKYTIHLLWFSAEDEGRTEQPSEQQKRRAREEGRVAKSVDLSAALILFAVVLVLAAFSRYLFRTLLEMIQFFLSRSADSVLLQNGVFIRLMLRYFVRLTAPALLVAMLIAVLANIFQTGFLFTLKPLRPDFKRIAPRFDRYLRRTFFSIEAGFNLLKSWIKLFIIAVVSILNITAQYERIFTALYTPLAQSTGFLIRLSFNILLQSAIILIVLAMFDLQFQRYTHRESLKVTPQQAKEERKTSEGNPLVRSRMRQRLQAILSSNMARNVPKADVVITNPTHYAVALQYESARMVAPTVIAKGSDAVAQRIRAIADEHDIPRIENKLLARALFDEVEIGDTIPEKFYEVVVAILAELYKLHGIPAGVV